MRAIFKYILFAVLPLAMLSSCESVIDIDLNSAEPQLVIEAGIRRGEDLLQVRVSRTADYFGAGESAKVTDASVVLFDGDGNPNPVPHVGDGLYALPYALAGAEGCRLEVRVDGDLHQAAATMPAQVEIQSLRSIQALIGGGFGQGNGENEVDYNVLIRLNDPPGQNNYYRVTYLSNGVPGSESTINVVNDQGFEGGVQEFPVVFGGAQFHSGDTVLVSLYSIDRQTYGYYRALSDLLASGTNPMGGSTAPGNPTGNWDGKALGNFTLSNPDTMSIVIP